MFFLTNLVTKKNIKKVDQFYYNFWLSTKDVNFLRLTKKKVNKFSKYNFLWFKKFMHELQTQFDYFGSDFDFLVRNLFFEEFLLHNKGFNLLFLSNKFWKQKLEDLFWKNNFPFFNMGKNKFYLKKEIPTFRIRFVNRNLPIKKIKFRFGSSYRTDIHENELNEIIDPVDKKGIIFRNPSSFILGLLNKGLILNSVQCDYFLDYYNNDYFLDSTVKEKNK